MIDGFLTPPLALLHALARLAVVSVLIASAAHVGGYPKDGAWWCLHRNVDAARGAHGAGDHGGVSGGSGPSGLGPNRPRGAARVFFDKPDRTLASPAGRPA